MSLCIFQEKEASKARKVELFDLIVNTGCLVKVMTNQKNNVHHKDKK